MKLEQRILAVLAALLSACSSTPSSDKLGTISQAVTTVCGAPASGPIQGVDVSHYQGNYDWAAAKTRGVVFGYASIGDGTGFNDGTFGTNWANMKAAGVLRGAYQYFEPADDAAAQANLMVAAVGQLGTGDLPCMVDVETAGGQSGATIASKVRTWVSVVQQGTGRVPFIYTGPYFWEGSVGDTSFGNIPLWIADYGPSCPKIPNGWSNWAIWQYGDSGGSLDTDVFNGTLAALEQIGVTCTNQCSNSPRIGIARAPVGQGYWIADSAGDVYPDGNASFFGNLQGVVLNKAITGIASTPDGRGYWLVAADGGVFSFGSAQFYGSAGNVTLNKPVVGLAETPTGKGYWLVAADGGIFSYGDANFYGSAGSLKLNAPVVGMAATPTGKGYWLVGADGGIFAYGDANFFGSTGGMKLNEPMVGMAATPSGQGYWLVAADGGSFTFGDAVYLGNALGSSCAGGIPQQCVVAGNGCFATQNATACAAGEVCGHGTCQSSCTDQCAGGDRKCSGTSIQVCGFYGDVPCNQWSSATACATGEVCYQGACAPCAAGAACASGDGCKAGAIDCSSGQPVCGSLVARQDGASCGSGVCQGGACTACPQGSACASANGCQSGTISCASGSAVCANITNSQDGTACAGGVCLAGSCVACAQGGICQSSGGCQTGTFDCATGSAVCSGLTNRPDGTGCFAGSCQFGFCVAASDAGSAGLDAGALPSSDAAAHEPDSGAQPADASAAWPAADAALQGDAAHATDVDAQSGCGCNSSGGAPSWLALGLLALPWRRRS